MPEKGQYRGLLDSFHGRIGVPTAQPSHSAAGCGKLGQPGADFRSVLAIRP
jgi:hypothetical protein